MMTSGKFKAGPHTKTEKLCSHLWPILEFLLCIFFFFLTVGGSGVHGENSTDTGRTCRPMGVGAVTKEYSIAFLL